MNQTGLDGLKLSDAVQRICDDMKPSSPALDTSPQNAEVDEPERDFGFCQICEHMIEFCECEDGPY